MFDVFTSSEVSALISSALSKVSPEDRKNGFTLPLSPLSPKSRILGRYVVAFTNCHGFANDSEAVEKLTAETMKHQKHTPVQKMTIGGWTSEAGLFYLDVGTTTDDLDLALFLGKQYDQIAIFDRLNLKEIKV